jgi:hypothetical protein
MVLPWGNRSAGREMCSNSVVWPTYAEVRLNQGTCVVTRQLKAWSEARRGVGTVQILALTEENSSDDDIVGNGLPAVLCMKRVDSVKNRKSVSLQLSFPSGRHLLDVRFVTSLKSNVRTVLTKQNTKEWCHQVVPTRHSYTSDLCIFHWDTLVLVINIERCDFLVGQGHGYSLSRHV